jgi:hypothetical protein
LIGRRGRTARDRSKGLNRLLDVLDPLGTKVGECKGQNFSDLIVGNAGDAYAPCLRHRLQAGGNIDTVTEKIAALDHDVANVDADTKVDVTVR